MLFFFIEKNIFSRKKHFFSKKRLQIENSGFVKTCDEYLHNGVPNGHGDNGTDIHSSCTCTKKETTNFMEKFRFRRFKIRENMR